jgi:hypothetical protein
LKKEVKEKVPVIEIKKIIPITGTDEIKIEDNNEDTINTEILNLL